MEPLRSQDPAVIGEFTLLARLGAGGMGRVYLGRSPGGTLVAVKVIREDLADEAGALARFGREVATVRTVRSAYTADLVGASLDAPPYWLATEFVPGPTLLRAVRDAPLAPELCTGLFAALAEALAAVHEQGVVHRDVKPHNVILSPAGPRLIDFGIARAVEQTRLTRTGQAPGTPGYTAPEVLTGTEAGPAADVFALGATLAAAATGRPPYGDGEWAIVSYRVVHGEIDVDGVHPGIAALIRDCVARDPGRRPTPREIIRRCGVRCALAEVPAYRALTAPAEPVPADLATAAAAGLVPPGHGARPRRRHVVPILAAALAVAAIATTATLTLLPDGDAGEEPRDLDVTFDDTAPPPPDIGGAEEEGPGRIVATNPVRDTWDGAGCNLEDEEDVPLLHDVYVEEGDGADGMGAAVNFGHNPAFGSLDGPYWVAAAVKPPHDIDPASGTPFEGSPNLSLGYASEAVDIASGEYVQLTYPDDFPGAIPLTNDPGPWTVLFYRVESPRDYVRIGCTGFTVD
ncbi:serine/threonine protein kinase [Streptomyces sp. URMC 129]|uniref:serine/threonine protein kinase n=1 Tax=Streptomyces sp. URMC 129 TaxID=3423407 RepID=UPI003F1E437F